MTPPSWATLVADHFVPPPMTFEDFAVQHPTELVDAVDRAALRPIRSVAEHFEAYLLRMADPAEQNALALALAEQRAKNARTRQELSDSDRR